jgi:mannosyltransferase OCH1-like enzyme
MQKIPKIIHCCWFGGKPMLEESRNHIKTWHEKCPDYSFMEHNESNFDINKYTYTKEAYKKGKWAFVSDVCRLEKLYEFGGIYIDINTKVLKTFDNLLDAEMFVGFEQDNLIAGCIFGAKKRHLFIKKIINDYYSRERLLDDAGKINFRTINNRMQEQLTKMGLKSDNTFQKLNSGIIVYPKEYFCPRYWNSPKEDKITKNTYSIHYFGASWHDKETRNQLLQQMENKKYPKLAESIISLWRRIRRLK